MGNCKKLSLLICFFLIVNQDIIGSKHFDKRQMSNATNKSDSIKGGDLSKQGPIKFLHLPHTSIYLK